MPIEDVTLLEMPPPDMPAALHVRAVDAIISGEPFMAQTEMDGYGRVLFLTKDVWPEFISCVLAVHEDVIRDRRERGAAAGGRHRQERQVARPDDGPPHAGRRVRRQELLQPGPASCCGSC